MTITIRPETIRDYNAVAEVNLLAFRTDDDCFAKEVVMVDTLRHRPEYDPDLALVAELDGRVVGYGLFSPCTIFFRGELTAAVILAPLAVNPDYQKQGIGGQLLAEGHRRAAAKGYKLCLLYGEKDYYPRFGYLTGMFSGRGLSMNMTDIAHSDVVVRERPLVSRDIPTLIAMWQRFHAEEPIAMFPGSTLLDWSSHYHNICASAVVIGDELVGYLRYLTDRPGAVLSFIARDAAASAAILGHLRNKLTGTGEAILRLPVNPSSSLVQELVRCPFESEVRMSIYAMIKVLDDEAQAVTDYCSYVAADRQNIGVLNLPPQFEWC